jgi:Chaperone of endosialidase/Putative peptidoglycan binding domain
MNHLHRHSLLTFSALAIVLTLIIRVPTFADSANPPPVNPTNRATTPASTSSTLSLPRLLYRGMSGSDVTSLQTFFIAHGFLATGNSTGFYGPLTEAAVKKFQDSIGISANTSGYGGVGPKTRAALLHYTNIPASSQPQQPTILNNTTASTNSASAPSSSQTVSRAEFDSLKQSLLKMIADSQRINQLSNVTFTSPTIIGGSLSGTSGAGSTIDLSNLGSLIVTGIASSTFANGINIAEGCFSINGTCIGGSVGGLLSLNGLSTLNQTFATSSTNGGFGFTSSGSTHTLNIPTASASSLGLLSSTDWSTFNNKQNALGFTPISNAIAKGNVLIGSDSGVAQATSSIFISSTGNVGIGTTSPTGTLVVQPVSDSTTAMQFLNSAGTNIFSINTTNSRVEIGTTIIPKTSGANVLYIGSGAGNTLSTCPGQLAIGQNALAANCSSGVGTVLAIGYYALNALTTGYSDIAIGTQALQTATNAQNNVAIGFNSQQLVTSGIGNTTIGNSSGQSIGGGQYNTVLGFQAMQFAKGSLNVAVGTGALQHNGAGAILSGNTVLGHHAMYAATDAVQNIAIGQATLYSCVTCANAIGIGWESNALQPPDTMTTALSSGSANLSVGNYEYKMAYVLNGVVSTVSQSNVVNVTTDSTHKEVTLSNIPTYSGPLTCSARKIYRTKVGVSLTDPARLLYLDGTINDCTTTTFIDSIPDSSLVTEVSDPGGYIVIANNTTGGAGTLYKSGQIVLGSDSTSYTEMWVGKGVYSATPSNILLSATGASGSNTSGANFIISGGPGTGTASGGSIIFQTTPAGTSGSLWNATSTVMTITPSGNVGIGLTNPSYLLHASTTNSGAVAGFTNSNGTCTINPTTSALVCSSDLRLKKDISALSPTDSLSKLSKLQAVAFHWNAESASDPTHYGFIAQNVEPIFPELVATDAAGYKSVAYGAFTPVIIDALKELNLKIDSFVSTSSSTVRVTDGSNPLDTLSYIAGQVVTGVVHFAQVMVDKITATLGVFKRVETDTLCVGSTCVTETELKSLLNKNGISPAATQAPAAAAPARTSFSTSQSDLPSSSSATSTSASATSTPAEATTTPVTSSVDNSASTNQSSSTTPASAVTTASTSPATTEATSTPTP